MFILSMGRGSHPETIEFGPNWWSRIEALKNDTPMTWSILHISMNKTWDFHSHHDHEPILIPCLNPPVSCSNHNFDQVRSITHLQWNHPFPLPKMPTYQWKSSFPPGWFGCPQVAITNCCTSLIAGCVTFPVLGESGSRQIGEMAGDNFLTTLNGSNGYLGYPTGWKTIPRKSMKIHEERVSLVTLPKKGNPDLGERN